MGVRALDRSLRAGAWPCELGRSRPWIWTGIARTIRTGPWRTAGTDAAATRHVSPRSAGTRAGAVRSAGGLSASRDLPCSAAPGSRAIPAAGSVNRPVGSALRQDPAARSVAGARGEQLAFSPARSSRSQWGGSRLLPQRPADRVVGHGGDLWRGRGHCGEASPALRRFRIRDRQRVLHQRALRRQSTANHAGAEILCGQFPDRSVRGLATGAGDDRRRLDAQSRQIRDSFRPHLLSAVFELGMGLRRSSARR